MAVGAGMVLVFWAVALVLGLCVFGFWVWSLIDCLTRSDDTFEPIFGAANPKIVWALIIFFAHILGTIIYLLIAGTKAGNRNSTTRAKVVEPEESRRILEMIAGGKITATEGQRLLAALETKSQQSTSAQTRAATPKALKIGCLLLLAIPIILILLAGLFFFGSNRRLAQVERSRAMQQQVEQQLGKQFGNGQQITFSSFTNVSPAAIKQ